MFCSDSDRIDRLVSFLTYCGIDAQKAYDEEDDSYALLVDSSDRRRASHLMQDFLEKEKERALAEQKKNEDRQPVPYSHVYEKYKWFTKYFNTTVEKLYSNNKEIFNDLIINNTDEVYI